MRASFQWWVSSYSQKPGRPAVSITTLNIIFRTWCVK
jgi:hypothetical protein